MKIIYALIFSLISIHRCACDKDEGTGPANNPGNSSNSSYTDTSIMKVTIGSTAFTATLSNNESATAFKARLPLTIDMADLNANEKYFDLPNNLPAAAANPGTIQVGDLMLYGSNTLVLFYKTFTTAYSYTRIGHIINTAGLTAALGSGRVRITFEKQ